VALRTLLWEFSKPYITVTVNRVSSTANGHKNMCNYISLKRTGTFLLMAHLGSPEKKAIKRVCVHVHWYFYAKFNFSAGGVSLWYLNYYYYYYYTCLTHLFPEHPGWAGTRKVKPIRILLKQETVSDSGISWAICKSASRSRQITTSASHHSVFYRPDALPATQPTVSEHRRQICNNYISNISMYVPSVLWRCWLIDR